jgi:hypothetical protein
MDVRQKATVLSPQDQLGQSPYRGQQGGVKSGHNARAIL